MANSSQGKLQPFSVRYLTESLSLWDKSYFKAIAWFLSYTDKVGERMAMKDKRIEKVKKKKQNGQMCDVIIESIPTRQTPGRLFCWTSDSKSLLYKLYDKPTICQATELTLLTPN